MKASTVSTSPFATRLLAICDLSQAELDWIDAAEAKAVDVTSGASVFEAGMPHRGAGIMVEGWGIKSKMLSDGRRQIVDFLQPGSLLGFESAVFDLADHTVETITKCRIAWVDPRRLVGLVPERPRLGMTILWTLHRDQAVLAERLLSLGQRTAYERLGHLLIELCYRLDARGLVTGGTYSLPINQNLLADALGLSVVHVSRTLSKLREDRLIDLTRSQLDIIDLEQLEVTCEFTPLYLHDRPLPDYMAALLDKHSG